MPPLELTLLNPHAPPVTLHMNRDVITMGRAADCDIPITDRFLSRRHAEIVSENGGWILRDNGSSNGTYLNGARVEAPVKLELGDQITLGDVRVVIGAAAPSPPAPAQLPLEAAHVTQFFLAENQVQESAERSRIIHALALELIEDRPLAELFDFILDRVVEVMRPSRAALAILTGDDYSHEIVKMRSIDPAPRALTISRTLLREVVRDRKVLAFTDVGSDQLLAAAHSMMSQSIYSALCAPLISGHTVIGVLYLDYQITRRIITEDDAQLAAQIARVAAMKLESTRLREAALEKGLLDETLKLAQAIQMRMLPQEVPEATADSSFDVAAQIRPARQVGGDFYDFYTAPDGKLYFCIGDVSGKGIPAALMMAVSRALFRSFILAGRTPASMMSAVNRQLCDETDEAMFVTAFCGVIDPATGEVRYSNAGHNPPMILNRDGSVRSLEALPGLVLGHLPQFNYVEQSALLEQGDVLYLYTDGISEATDAADELFSVERLERLLSERATSTVRDLAAATIAAVNTFVGDAPQSDDLTLLCIRFLRRSTRVANS
ncbi:MAG TPA: SpoIIE family protein phosphatase [Thermoanaerobaculia bacterium]|nr:SpoIIE family protein phosphatase [Thermoanaerobaculia bacterium]